MATIFLYWCIVLLVVLSTAIAMNIELETLNNIQTLFSSTVNTETRPPEDATAGKHQYSLEKLIEMRSDIKKMGRADPNFEHELVFAVKPRDKKSLEELLNYVSYPNSKNYGKYLSREEVIALTINEEAIAKTVDFLKKHGARIISRTAGGEYITASTSIGVWEKLLNAEFYVFHQMLDSNEKKILFRTFTYQVPEALTEHLSVIFNTMNFPNVHKEAIYEAMPISSSLEYVPGLITPAQLNYYYDIRNNTANINASQCVYESLNQTYSPSDLSTFQRIYNLPQEQVAQDIGGHSENDACKNSSDCLEANLDIQYIMAVSQSANTTYYYTNDWMLEFCLSVANMTDPPQVISISYSSYEIEEMASYYDTFNVEAMKLGLMGVTLLSAAGIFVKNYIIYVHFCHFFLSLICLGDDGVAGYLARSSSLLCGYWPQFPASSPYVTAVGGTDGAQNNASEIVCQSNVNNAVITTGGGFSTLYPRPEWQTDSINTYLSAVQQSSDPPSPGYNENGRGYPDVSFAAANYSIVVGGNLSRVYGTSASTPVFAGMVALANAKRNEIGKPSLGWINPALYSEPKSILLNDITSGKNDCTAKGVICCSQGFTAVEGWDPASGLGSLNFTKFLKYAVSLGDNDYEPTPSPTIFGQPTMSPVTKSPVAMPTVSPTLSPGWVTISVSDGIDCSTPTSVTGILSGQCIQVYENGTVVGSTIVICSDNGVRWTTQQYSDPNCQVVLSNISSPSLFTGCSKNGDSSVNVACSATTAIPLPSNPNGYTTMINYNDPEPNSCEELTSFTSFVDNYCVNVNNTNSFEFDYPNLLFYSKIDCSGFPIPIPLPMACFTDSSILPSSSLRQVGTSSHFAVASKIYASLGSTVSLSSSSLQNITIPLSGLNHQFYKSGSVPSLPPTPVPSTATPTVMPTENQQVVIPVIQVLNGISESEYNANYDENNEVFSATVAASINGITSSDVIVNSVSTASRRLSLMNTIFTIVKINLNSNSVSINYDIDTTTLQSGYVDGTSAVQSIESQLNNSISKGYFDSNLTMIAIQNNVADLVNVTSSTVTYGDPTITTVDSTNNKSTNLGLIIGLSIGLPLAVFIFATFAFYWNKASKLKFCEMSSDETDPIVEVSKNPLGASSSTHQDDL